MSDENAQIPDNVRVLSNGTWQDKQTGHFIKGGNTLTAIKTPSQARDMAQYRHERKRQIIREAAAAAVERDDYRLAYGNDAWIAAVAEAQYIKATTPDDAKSTDAARFLLTESGLAEKQAESAPVVVQHEHTLDDDTRRLLAAIAQAQGAVIDAEEPDVGAGAGGTEQ